MNEYQNGYTFEKHHRKNGLPTRWYQALQTLVYAEDGCLNKRQILHKMYSAVPSAITTDLICVYNPYGDYVHLRGYCSNMFSAMKHGGLVEYDRHLRRWFPTTKGKYMVLAADIL